LVISFVGNVCFWNCQYAAGIRSSYDLGFSSGYDEGCSLGYQLGFNEGNQSGYYLGYNSGNSSGYQQGYSDGNTTGFAYGYIQGVEDGAGRGYTVRDPTYAEAIAFVNSDTTDENEYSETYVCLHYSADFKNNAFEAGYRCGYTHIKFPETAHAIVCFNTVDEGLIFIEPQLDDIVTLVIGDPYWNRTIYEPPDYDDTIVSFDIIW
jgi:hypothetical protein